MEMLAQIGAGGVGLTAGLGEGLGEASGEAVGVTEGIAPPPHPVEMIWKAPQSLFCCGPLEQTSSICPQPFALAYAYAALALLNTRMFSRHSLPLAPPVVLLHWNPNQPFPPPHVNPVPH